MNRLLFFLLSALLAAAPAGLAESGRSGGKKSSKGKEKANEKYVNTPTAQIKEDKNLSANTVAEVARGKKLKVLDPGDGRWLKVALAENPSVTGWIYFNKLVDQQPKDESSQLAFGGGITTSDLETSGSIRGLTKASQAYAKSMSSEEREKASEDIHRIQTFPLNLKEFDKNGNGNLESEELQAANEARKKWFSRRVEQFVKEGKMGEYAE